MGVFLVHVGAPTMRPGWGEPCGVYAAMVSA